MQHYFHSLSLICQGSFLLYYFMEPSLFRVKNNSHGVILCHLIHSSRHSAESTPHFVLGHSPILGPRQPSILSFLLLLVH